MALRLVTPPAATASGILAKDSAVVAGIDDTSLLVGAVRVTGTGVPSGTFVESIDDAHTLTLTKPATVEGDDPVAVELAFTMEVAGVGEARMHLRQTDTGEDALIARLLGAARRACERRSGRTFLESVWELTLDEWPGGGDAWIRVPNPPLVSVSSITYLDDAGATATLSPSLYLATAGTPGLVSPAYGTSWPYGRYQPGAVTVRYVAGYGPTADSVPEDAKVAILLMLGHLYDNRGDVEAPVPSAVAEMLAGVWSGRYA